ncbi:hypothetical protein WICPIJ_007690 [Wickerhamomyces pijperi]|uniref:Uncharacterized protein n=1 Tax=Wickerhamomyces pijperi TaxID=599730 RepID=A0A9P8Q012_WICPI|nr:hypothetical protein WICPIJ_007690 [Wickerhamomyces pijperi]
MNTKAAEMIENSKAIQSWSILVCDSCKLPECTNDQKISYWALNVGTWIKRWSSIPELKYKLVEFVELWPGVEAREDVSEPRVEEESEVDGLAAIVVVCLFVLDDLMILPKPVFGLMSSLKWVKGFAGVARHSCTRLFLTQLEHGIS